MREHQGVPRLSPLPAPAVGPVSLPRPPSSVPWRGVYEQTGAADDLRGRLRPSRARTSTANSLSGQPASPAGSCCLRSAPSRSASTICRRSWAKGGGLGAADFVRKYSRLVRVELDALAPDTLRGLNKALSPRTGTQVPARGNLASRALRTRAAARNGPSCPSAGPNRSRAAWLRKAKYLPKPVVWVRFSSPSIHESAPAGCDQAHIVPSPLGGSSRRLCSGGSSRSGDVACPALRRSLWRHVEKTWTATWSPGARAAGRTRRNRLRRPLSRSRCWSRG